MREWAFSGGAKIERAKEHIAEFESASRAFLQTHLYYAVGQHDPESGHVLFGIEGAHIVPARLAAIASDAIHNLRASLDILWRDAFYQGTPPGDRGNLFPISARTAKELETRFRSVKKAHHRASVDILLNAARNEAWDKLFWLNEIETRDKHEIPILATATYNQIAFKFPPNVAINGKTGITIVADLGRFHFLKHGAKLPIDLAVKLTDGSVVDMECDLATDIAFGEGEILEGEPVLKTLHDAVQIIDGMAQAFLIAGLIK